MKHLTYFINRYFWILSLTSYSIIVYLIYGFTRNLYFWRDDYALLYRLQQGGLFNFPYQGWSISYLPIYLFSKDNPFGYFFSALALYIIFCLFLNFFVWKLLKDKLVAYLTGLIFASGYIGGEMMLMSSVSVSSLTYIILSTLLILIYLFLFDKKKLKYLLLLFLYLVITLIFSQRAHTLILFLCFTGIYLIFSSKIKINRSIILLKLILWTLPFLVITFSTYFLYGRTANTYGVGTLSLYLKNFSFDSILIIFANLGNFLFPEIIGEIIRIKLITLGISIPPDNLVILGVLGIIEFIFIIYFLFSYSLTSKQKLFGIFMLFLWIGSYFNYYLQGANVIQSSTTRYLLFGYPFFAGILALIIKEIFFSKKNILLAAFGAVLVLLLVIVHQRQFEPLRFQIQERDKVTRSFFSDLKIEVPNLKGKTLFYFDITSDKPTWVSFGDILRVGIYPTEAAVASFYKTSIDYVKIVDSYQEFTKQEQTGSFVDSYRFFYSKDKKLINVSRLLKKDENREVNLDLGRSELLGSYITSPKLINNNGSAFYQTAIINESNNSKGVNGALQFNSNSFPSYKQVQLEISLETTLLLSKIKQFPYYDNLIIIDPLQKPFNLIQDLDLRNQAIVFIKKRIIFESLPKSIKSSSSTEGKEVDNAVDGNIDTSWEANKRDWFSSNQAFIEITFPNNDQFSQSRWISSHLNRLPSSYEYQVYEEGGWRTIFKKEAVDLSGKKYAIDSFPPVMTKHFRMIINKTLTGDFPGISEIQLLPTTFMGDEELVNFLLEHPLAEVKNLDEALQIIQDLSGNIFLEVYPLSDKFSTISEDAKKKIPLMMDSNLHIYKIEFPPQGTNIQGFILKFPNLPLEVNIRSIKLKTTQN